MTYNPYATNNNNNNSSATTYNNSGYTSSQGSSAYAPSSQSSSAYAPSSQGSSAYVPSPQGSSPYAPSSQISSPCASSSQGGGYQTSTLSPSPPLSNIDGWFNYYDLDRSGTLDKEEVVHALIQTTGAASFVEQSNIRETVINVFAAFDSNGNGSICKREFCAPGGLGQSLQAATMQQNQGQYSSNAPNGGASAQMYQHSQLQNPQPPAPYKWKQPDQSSYGPQDPQPQRHQQQQQFQLMRSSIPDDMQPGQQLQVRVGPAGSLMHVTIPDRCNWITANGQQLFEFKILANPSPLSNLPVTTPGTYVPQLNNQNMSQPNIKPGKKIGKFLGCSYTIKEK